jgi:heme exporter protein B
LTDTLLELKHIFYITVKDLRLEIRRKYELFSMITFALISVLVSSLTLGPLSPSSSEVIPALIWIILLFTGMLGFYAAFTREMEQGTIDGLRVLPSLPQTMFLGKIIFGFVLMGAVEVALVPVSLVLFGFTFNSDPLFVLLVFTLGTIDFAIVGAMVSGLTMYAESRTMLIPLLTFPMVLPVMIPTVLLTKKLVSGLVFAFYLPELRIIGLSLIALFVATTLLFEYVFTE